MERKTFIDVAKGILIMLVVMIHVPIALHKVGYDYPFVCYPTNETVFLYVGFFMQAFFLLSGFTSNFDKLFGAFLRGNIRGLLIPFLFLGIFTKILETLLFGDNFWTLSIDKEHYFFLVETLWFLPAMFIARLMYWTIHRITSNDLLRAIIVLLVLIAGVMINNIYLESNGSSHYHNYFHYRNAMCLCIFLWIGDCMKRYTIIDTYAKYIGYCYIPLLAISHIYPKFHPISYTDSSTLTVVEIPAYIIFAISGTFLLLEVSKILKDSTVLTYFGRNSLVVYGLHFLVMQCVAVVLSEVLVPEGKLLSMVYYIVFLLLCWLGTIGFTALFVNTPLRYCVGKQ